VGVGSGSGGPGESRATAAVELAGKPFPAAARGPGSPEFTEFGALGSNRHGLGSGMDYTSCVIHLGSKRGLGMLGAACTVAEAALRGVARRRARVGLL